MARRLAAASRWQRASLSAMMRVRCVRLAADVCLGPASVRGRFFSGSGERSGDKKSKKVVSYVEPKRPSLPVR